MLLANYWNVFLDQNLVSDRSFVFFDIQALL